MKKNEDRAYDRDEQAVSSVAEGSRANELGTIGNTGGMSRLVDARRPRGHVANPGDPLVHQPRQGPHGPLPGPHYFGLQGRTAIVQGQVYLVAIILIAQLWLVTDALYELLSGHSDPLVRLALASTLGFVLALIITFWPRRRIEEL
jgi:hypothetical protein